jgi:ascorbate-specific PTS system EIIC-type component UlaA
MEFLWQNLPIPWGIIVSLGVVLIALFIKYFLDDIIEDDRQFEIIIGTFLIIYAGAAYLVGSLNPITIVHGAFNTDGMIVTSSNDTVSTD